MSKPAKPRLQAIGALLVLLLTPFASAEPQNQKIARLVEELIKVADPSPGVGMEVQEISDKLAKLDSKKVIAATLPLLSHKKPGVPYLASYVILDSKSGLKPGHFELLKKGFHNGGGWLPSAIASLGTDDAAKFLAEEFRKNPEIHGQIDWSLTRMGAKAIPHLLKGINSADAKFPDEYLSGIGSILKEMKAEATIKAAPLLLRTVRSTKLPDQRRQQALLLFGPLGKPAASHFPDLKKLVAQDPEVFGESLTEAMIASGTRFAAETLADQVDKGADQYVVWGIALLGKEALPLGPRILGWLDHNDWEVRVMAARAIGVIGFMDGREKLEEILSCKNDWRLAYAAAISLGILSSEDSLPALQKASTEHWFPIVRNVASTAITKIQEKIPMEENSLNSASRLSSDTFVSREHLSIKSSKIPSLGEPKKTARKDQPFTTFESERPELAKEFIKLRNTSGADFLGFARISTLPIEGGELLGAAAGEWTGGLQYLPKDGNLKHLMQANIFGMEEWQNVVLIASGTYHMGMNEGFLHQFNTIENEPRVAPWFILPGEPNKLWIDDKDQLVVACIGGTMVFKDKDHFTYHSDPEKVDVENDSPSPDAIPLLPAE